jgi:hypothetical protein
LKLIGPNTEQTHSTDTNLSSVESAVDTALTDDGEAPHPPNVSDIRRERRERRRAAGAEAAASGADARPRNSRAERRAGVAVANANAAGIDQATKPEAESAGHEAARGRPHAPRANRGAARPRASGRAGDGRGAGSDAAPVPAPQVMLLDPSESSRRAERTATRARRKQEMAAGAVANADNNPALGALNRHLNMMMQQLNTAHRVIGRVAAERDALRQQLADLQGIPVEEIKVTTIGTATATEVRSNTASASTEPSRLQRLNFLGGDDIALVRKRRQMFVGILILIGVVVALVARQLHWSMPGDVSKNGLAALPYVGQFMTIFLAGWLLFRVIRVSTKGIKWVFPSDDRKRRRR